jgi:hypothetical protein
MSKCAFAFAAALSVLLLSSCGSREQVAVENGAVDAEADALVNASPSDPIQPGMAANAIVDPVPPPDAVSHPGGYLPPAPGGADPTPVNSTGSDPSPPATEDEYIRNKQAGR